LLQLIEKVFGLLAQLAITLGRSVPLFADLNDELGERQRLLGALALGLFRFRCRGLRNTALRFTQGSTQIVYRGQQFISLGMELCYLFFCGGIPGLRIERQRGAATIILGNRCLRGGDLLLQIGSHGV
jgi:hypothetical protein